MKRVLLRLTTSLILLWLVMTAVFFTVHLAPGDPTNLFFQPGVSAETKARRKAVRSWARWASGRVHVASSEAQVEAWVLSRFRVGALTPGELRLAVATIREEHRQHRSLCARVGIYF